MSWSKKYKKSINCSNPKGFSQKAHCAGKNKKKNEDMVFEEITEDILKEKLITYSNRKPYGQVVFIAGGAGSGKGFAISNFLDSASFKIRDVDEMKKQLQILNRLGKLDIRTILKKYGRNIKLKDLDLIRKIEKDGYKLQNLNLKNSDHVYALHIMVKAMGIKDSSLEKLLLGKNNPETLPNILFDITAKDVTDITSVIPKLKAVGYEANNIHLTWILTNYVTAMVNNKNRARMVPEDILLKTHEGASNTIWGLVTKALPKGMNGRVDVILNNPQHTVFLKGADGKDLEKTQRVKRAKTDIDKDGKRKTIRSTKDTKVKFTAGFLSLPLKKQKGGIFSEKLWRDKLFNWVKDNAPDSVTDNMTESVVNEDCWKGYKQVGGKMKNGKMVPNCVPESVVSEDSPESAHPQGSDKLTNRTVVMDMLDVISHMKFGPDYHKLSTSQKKEVHKEAIKGHIIKNKPFKESVNEAGVNVWYFYKKANKDKNKFFKMLSDFRKKHSDTEWIKMLNYALEDFNENPTKYKTIDDKQNILFKNLQTNKKAYESVNEAYIVLHSPKKGVKPVTTAAYKDKKDAEKWAKELGGITMIVQKKMKGIDEAQQVNSKSVDVLRRAVQKINKKYKVQVSKHPVTKGEVEIELGDGNHPDRDYHAIDKLVSKLGIKKYSIFNESAIEEQMDLFVEENVPTDASKWSYYKAQAKKKFDVYPSAYANGWAAKKYKAAGGGWKKKKK